MNIQVNINKNANTYSGTEADVVPVKNELNQNDQTKGQVKDLSCNHNQVRACVMPRTPRFSWDRPKKVEDAPKDNQNTNSDFDFAKGMTDMFTSFIEGFKAMMQEYMAQIKDMVKGILDNFMSSLKPVETPKVETPKVENTPIKNIPKPEQANKVATPEPTPQPRVMKSFADRMPEIMQKNVVGDVVNEADLQAGIVAYQLYQKSEDAEQFFLSKYNELKETMGPNEALKQALIESTKANKISKSEANFVYSLSHRAAQIDSNHDDVNTIESGAGTIDFRNGIKGAEINLAKVISGDIILTQRTII